MVFNSSKQTEKNCKKDISQPMAGFYVSKEFLGKWNKGPYRLNMG